ncbi:MAG: GDSL-type esterase/lipase family protein [Verrucomicrobiales bacterium]
MPARPPRRTRRPSPPRSPRHADPAKPGTPTRRQGWARSRRRTSARRSPGRGADVCFLGDSLVEFWGKTGRDAWLLDFHDLGALNAGIAADRIEHVRYRAERLKFAAPGPRAFVILAGTNNLAKEPPDDPAEVAAAVAGLAARLRERFPEAKVAILSILPSGYDPAGALRDRIAQANAALEKACAAREGIDFLEVGSRFLDGGGRWKAGLTADGTHLSYQGYGKLGPPVRAWIDAALGQASP